MFKHFTEHNKSILSTGWGNWCWELFLCHDNLPDCTLFIIISITLSAAAPGDSSPRLTCVSIRVMLLSVTPVSLIIIRTLLVKRQEMVLCVPGHPDQPLLDITPHPAEMLIPPPVLQLPGLLHDAPELSHGGPDLVHTFPRHCRA